MTVSSQTSKNGPYDCNGSQVTFPFTFKVFSKNDLLVVLTDVSSDVESDLTVDTEYSVTLNADQNNSPGGSITTVTVYPSGQRVTIARNVALTQQVSITNFRPEVFERAFDKLTMLVQQVAEGVSRAVKTKISSTVSSDELLTALDASVAAATEAAAQSSASAASSENSAMDAAASEGAAEAAALAASNTPVAVPTHAAASKTTPADLDELPLIDSAASWGLKKLTWANLKAALKTYFDPIYKNEPGLVFLWPFPTAPAGALAIPLVPTNASRSTYAGLHAVAQAQGYPWGSGDGSTTFGLPYLQADGTWLQANGNIATSTSGQVIGHSHQQQNSARDQDQGGGGTGPNTVGSPANMGLVTSNQSTLSTGGSANIAAGSRGLWCIWL